jgi:eukaryotic translation initiation factor 2C
MDGMVEERLEAWFKKNNPSTHKGPIRFPTSILFYRDGISESQFAHCKNGEIPAIRRAFARFATKHNRQNAPFKLTFVVVGKRHHTRFFPASNVGEHNGNVKAGLLVDQVVTAPAPKRNFFLQSHTAVQGTARSAHYHVLEDGIGFPDESLENLTHHLCYSFARATKGVSYAAPAYIADRLCERGRAYLRVWTGGAQFKTPTHPGGRQYTPDELQRWRTTKAQEISNDNSIWGNYNANTRRNPWHSNLDDVMFWM